MKHELTNLELYVAGFHTFSIRSLPQLKAKNYKELLF